MPRPMRSKKVTALPASRVAKQIPSTANSARGAIEDEENDAEESNLVDGPRNSGPIAVARSLAPQPITRSPANIRQLQVLEKSRDGAMARLEAATASTDGGSADTQPSALDDEDTPSSPAVEYGRRDRSSFSVAGHFLFQRRARKPSILGGGQSRARSSSVESNQAEELGIAGGSIQRRPSFLNRPQSRARSSSIGLEVGATPQAPGSILRQGQLLRKRARQPSILGTAQKDQSRKKELENANVDDEEDDFNPEDESTPLNLSKTKSMAEQSPQSTSSAINPRKRKFSPIEVRSSSSVLPSTESDGPQSENEPPQSLPSNRSATPEILSETMAPPQSSSPAEESPEPFRQSRRPEPNLPSQSTRRQTKRKINMPSLDSPPSSPPSLTHSPNRAASPAPRRGPRRNNRAQPEPQTMSTVQLQALLPRRRRHVTRDLFDVGSSEEGFDVHGIASDEDELSALGARSSTRRPRRATSTVLVAPARRVARLRPGPKTKAAKEKELAGQDGGSKRRRTYGIARGTSDKENEGGEEEEGDGELNDSLFPMEDEGEPENSQELEARVGPELKRAKRMFEDVDRWEMEFEDVTASSSSPWDGR